MSESKKPFLDGVLKPCVVDRGNVFVCSDELAQCFVLCCTLVGSLASKVFKGGSVLQPHSMSVPVRARFTIQGPAGVRWVVLPICEH